MATPGRFRVLGSILVVLAVVALWWATDDNGAAIGVANVSIAAAPTAPSPPPAPRATSPAEIAATLRAQSGPPSPELLRDNPQAQAAYDASAQPGDYVTPPSVSVEH